MSIERQVMDRLFGTKKPGEIPVILCRRYMKVPTTYKLHDSSWEGLTAVRRGSGFKFTIHHNFNLIINEDGTCEIPDTPENRKRLERLSKPVISEATIMRKDAVTGKMRPVKVKVTEQPLYQRIEGNMVEDSVIDRIALRVLEMQNNPRIAEDLEEAETDYQEGLAADRTRQFGDLEVIEELDEAEAEAKSTPKPKATKAAEKVATKAPTRSAPKPKATATA